jgi:hypothetical protein
MHHRATAVLIDRDASMIQRYRIISEPFADSSQKDAVKIGAVYRDLWPPVTCSYSPRLAVNLLTQAGVKA